MLTFIMLGGPLMWLIILLGTVALAVFLERIFHLHRARIKATDFLKGITNILQRHNIAEALTICEETPGPVPSITRAAIQQYRAGPQAVSQAIDQAALVEIGRMERRTAMLAIAAQVGPLMGLLGTVMGLIQMLIVIQQKAPLIQAADLATGMWQALLTSAAGLIVAIVAMLGYNLVMAKIDILALDMEQSAGDVKAMVAELENTSIPQKTANGRKD
ncbi:MAG: MotA/TolQ/ExbB proton channel family protein [Kiritimatiellia bacterium]